MYGPDSDHIIFTLELAWQAALKNTKVKLDLLTDIDMFIMVEKGIKVEYVILFVDMRKLIINT